MKNNILINTALIALLISACGKKDPKQELENLKKQQSELAAQIKQLEIEVNKSEPAKATAAILVGVLPIVSQDFNHYIEVQGKVDSDENILVSSLTGGTITKVYVKEGDRVQKGQLLATIDADVLVSTIAEVKNSLALATTVFEKQEALWKQNIGTEIQFLQAKNNKESLEKKLETLNVQFNSSKIKATIDGVVDKIIFKAGESVGPGPMFRIVNLSGFKVEAEVAESYSDKVRVGDPVDLFFPDFNKTVHTNILTIGNVVNQLNRTFTIECRLASSGMAVKPNMITKVKIKDYSKRKTIVIPVNSIQKTENESFVFVAIGTKAVKKTIKVGTLYGTDAEIIEGLSVGDNLIVTGYQELVDGQEIKQ